MSTISTLRCRHHCFETTPVTSMGSTLRRRRYCKRKAISVADHVYIYPISMRFPGPIHSDDSAYFRSSNCIHVLSMRNTWTSLSKSVFGARSGEPIGWPYTASPLRQPRANMAVAWAKGCTTHGRRVHKSATIRQLCNRARVFEKLDRFLRIS